jgi:hypothetical protein
LTISLQPLGLSLLGSPILSSLGFGAFLTLYLCYLREVAISIRSGFSIWKVRCVQLKGIRVGRDKGWYAGLSAYGTSPLFTHLLFPLCSDPPLPGNRVNQMSRSCQDQCPAALPCSPDWALGGPGLGLTSNTLRRETTEALAVQWAARAPGSSLGPGAKPSPPRASSPKVRSRLSWAD